MVWFYTGDLISLISPELSGYTRLSVVFGLEILFCIIAVMIIARKNPIGAVEELELLESLPAGLLVSVVITLPLPLIFSLSSPISDDIEGIRLLYFAFFSPLEEEIIFRGFAFWMLYKYARLGFWGASRTCAIFPLWNRPLISGRYNDRRLRHLWYYNCWQHLV
jgi:hypothetical protein